MLKFILEKGNPRIEEVGTNKQLQADSGTIKGFKQIYKQGIKEGIKLDTINQLEDYAMNF